MKPIINRQPITNKDGITDEEFYYMLCRRMKEMGYDFTDSIDECCEAIVGHTNWGFADKSDYEKIMSRRNGDHPNSDRIHSIVIFYNDEEDEEEGEQYHG
tara:strand:- start:267 stop:566 length:300 start_codon:yes stop_codon:yes gene_type:complete